MKAAAFDYIRPETVTEVCELLAASEDARIVAGGQTLIPMLAMRLARPTKLVDIFRIDGLSGIRKEGDSIVIGATTRQVQAEHNPLVRASLPLLARVLPWVGHPPTRNRGTVGGSIANADPSAEIPLVAVTLGAELAITNLDGDMAMPVDDFFLGPMLTTMMPGDCLTAVHFPVWTRGRIGTGFHEVSARKSDFAFVAAAAQVALDEDGRCLDIALGLGGVGDRPTRLDMSSLIGGALEQSSIADAVREATHDLDASSDLHASAGYRCRVAVALCLRALNDAIADAAKSSQASARGAAQ